MTCGHIYLRVPLAVMKSLTIFLLLTASGRVGGREDLQTRLIVNFDDDCPADQRGAGLRVMFSSMRTSVIRVLLLYFALGTIYAGLCLVMYFRNAYDFLVFLQRSLSGLSFVRRG